VVLKMEKKSTDPWQHDTLFHKLYESGHIPKGWTAFFEEPKVKSLIRNISKELETQSKIDGLRIFPRPEEVFRALSVPPEDVKAIIQGQDPYSNFNSAEGLCFSVRKGNKVNPSLKNMFKALHEQGIHIPQDHGSLEDWTEEGVLLLNTALTVTEGQANSHRSLWSTFTNMLVDYILKRTDKVVWFLWGKQAQTLIKRIKSEKGKTFHILACPHPSPLAGTRFVDYHHENPQFQQCNLWLMQQERKPINWNLY